MAGQAHCLKFPECMELGMPPECRREDCPTKISRQRFASIFADAASDQVERVAQALFDRLCERCAARGHTPHHPQGTLVRNMPPSYRDDYLDDARAVLRVVHG